MQNYLIWTDLETGGLSGQIETGELGCSHYPIFEIAIIVTDSDLNEIGKPLHIFVHQEEEDIAKSHQWAIDEHTKTGLLDNCRKYGVELASAEQMILAHLKALGVPQYDRKEKTGGVMAGNSITLDRMFISAQMPNFESYMHYRQLDISGIAMAARLWAPEAARSAIEHKKYLHEALSDIRESIAEAKAYRDLFKLLPQ